MFILIYRETSQTGSDAPLSMRTCNSITAVREFVNTRGLEQLNPKESPAIMTEWWDLENWPAGVAMAIHAPLSNGSQRNMIVAIGGLGAGLKPRRTLSWQLGLKLVPKRPPSRWIETTSTVTFVRSSGLKQRQRRRLQHHLDCNETLNDRGIKTRITPGLQFPWLYHCFPLD